MQQSQVRDRQAGMRHEIAQEVKFFRRKVNRLAGLANQPASRVKLYVSNPDHRVRIDLGCAGTPDGSPDPRCQPFLFSEDLFNVGSWHIDSILALIDPHRVERCISRAIYRIRAEGWRHLAGLSRTRGSGIPPGKLALWTKEILFH